MDNGSPGKIRLPDTWYLIPDNSRIPSALNYCQTCQTGCNSTTHYYIYIAQRLGSDWQISPAAHFVVCSFCDVDDWSKKAGCTPWFDTTDHGCHWVFVSWLLTVVSSELHSSDRIGQQGEKDQRPSSNSGPTLYRGVSATWALDPSWDPPSPIALKCRSRVCRHPVAA